MAKEENIQASGVVIEVLPRAMFRVEIELAGENKHVMICTLAGKMRQNKIRVLLGDRVDIEFTPYDFERGRITRRQK